jgi:diguanylate cyclase (GGDEF)-like protein
MVEKLFSLLSSFVEYHVAGVYFSSPDDFAENILYIDTLGRNLPKNLLSDVSYDFFRKMEDHKTIKGSKFEVVRMILGKETTCEFGDLTSKIIIPLVFDKKLIGGICFYTKQEVDYSSFGYFDIMISELLTIFKMKYQYTEKEFMSVLDALTGLYNRRQFEISLEQECNRTKRHPSDFSLAILDIDFFKKVNDTYGHNCGDYTLKELSSLFLSRAGEAYQVCRWGGEEFCFFLPQMNLDEAGVIMRDLHIAVGKMPLHYEEIDFSITLTIGLTENDFHSSLDKLMDEADRKLYMGKANGRNQVVI